MMHSPKWRQLQSQSKATFQSGRIEARTLSAVSLKDNVTLAFCVGGPEHDHTIQTVLFLEPLHISPNMIEMNLCVHPGDQVVHLGFFKDWPRRSQGSK